MNIVINDRIVKIMTLARELDWISPPNRSEPYPNMMISEVEKCMAAMADDTELKRMEKWVAEKNQYKG